jgi:hypothetical protein
MLTAHIAALNVSGSSPLVGRINSASEGSVSVGAENLYPHREPLSGINKPNTVQHGGPRLRNIERMRYSPGPVMPVGANQGSLGGKSVGRLL